MSRGPWKKGRSPKPRFKKHIIPLEEQIAGWLEAHRVFAMPLWMIKEQFAERDYKHVRNALSNLLEEDRVTHPARGYWMHKEKTSVSSNI